jgi:CHAD domain-containing protein
MTRFGLRRREDAPDGVRRIARGQLEGSAERLEGARGKDIGEAIHDTRKSFKRLRALVRLARDPLGDDVYRFENHGFRDAGRELSGARDAQVLGETLDELADRYADELPKHAFAGLRRQLEEEARTAHAQVAEDDQATDRLTATLEAAHGRVATWPLPEEGGWGMLEPGFTRIYRRGRRALRVAADEPTTENLHELRKRAKDLWHAAQILRPAAPRRLKRLAKEAHELSDLLGDDHDLAVLRVAARERVESLQPGELAVLEALIGRRRARLQRRALRCGRRVYARKPGAWAKRLALGTKHAA